MKTRVFRPAVIFFLVFIARQACAQETDLQAVRLRTEFKVDPVTDVLNPRLSWELLSKIRSQTQTAYQIIVASSVRLLTEKDSDYWNTGKINGDASNHVAYQGKDLSSRMVCYWKVRAWDKSGRPGSWSAPGKWEMGLLRREDWTASWIGNDLTRFGRRSEYHLPPAPYFRKEVEAKGKIRSARLYVTALGLYEFSINGARIGSDYFSPGWTDYGKRVYYQTYDISGYLKNGKNVLGAIVSEGWYAGYLGYALLVGNPTVHQFYGKIPLLRAQIEITYENGDKKTVVTDSSWQSGFGPIVEADILNGETYDARKEFAGWEEPGFNERQWVAAVVYPDNPDRAVQCYPGVPVRRISELKAVSVSSRPNGKYIVDLGQNFAGVVRLKVKGEAGDSVRLRYGEVLFPDGSLMTENLRKARATDVYVLKGNKEAETWVPRFTYHGFQYVEISGLRTRPPRDAITGLVMGSSTPEAGSLQTDNSLINKLYHNIVWTQRANYFDVPTDCPQRDERLGWTGDAQAYVQSAAYNTDIAAFFTKWLVDLNDAQRPDGTYPLYAPAPNLRSTDTYSPGWSDAGIICPYTMYRNYGDTEVIRKCWSAMTSYMTFLKKKSKNAFLFTEGSFEDIAPKGGFGDWLSVGKKTPPDMLATMYYGQNARMMAEMAKAAGKEKDAQDFSETATRINEAFRKHYMDRNNRFVTDTAAYGTGEGYVDGQMGFDGHTQTAYANAIYMGMLQPDLREQAGDWLAGLIHANGDKLSTGFLGVKPLLPALSATGHTDLAYRLLLSTEYPSWGFEVVNGANTIWERWNSYIKGKGFESNAQMNSFNHYAFGSVNEWLFGNMAGITALDPGYRTVSIRPEIAAEKINRVDARFHSMFGEIHSSWQKKENDLIMDVTIPVSATALICIPASGEQFISEGGRLLKDHRELQLINSEKGYVIVKAGSGRYHFVVKK